MRLFWVALWSTFTSNDVPSFANFVVRQGFAGFGILQFEQQIEEVAMARCVELGHALGNQHWPAVTNGTRVYVPLTVARAVMASVMKTHAFAGISYAFAPGAEVIPYLAPHEVRRLLGTALGHEHLDAPGEVTR